MAYNASLANFMESQGVPYSDGITALAPVVFGNQGQFTASDISNFIAQNINNPQAIAQAAQQHGVSAQDIQKAAGYTPTQQAEYLGGAGIASLQPLTVEQLYQDVLGRKSDTGGAEFWTQKFGTTIDPNEIAEFRSAAAPELVQNAYKTVLGRAAEDAGSNYFTQQLQSGSLASDKLADALAYGAQGLDRLAAQKYLGKDIYAPSDFLTKTSGLSYQDVVDYINANVQDPVKIAQAAAQFKVTPADILAAKQAVGGQHIPTIKEIEDYLAQGKAGLGTRIQDIITSTIGDADLIKTIEGALPTSASRVASFTPESFATTRLEDIERLIAESPTNKLQEAGRIRGLAENVFGMTADQARKLASDLYTGKDTDDFAEGVYKDLLTKGFTKDVQNQVFLNAAKTTPNSKFFKDNPDALLAYSPLTEKTGQTGVYGYLNNAPILNANFADQKLGEKNQVVPHLGSDPNKFGWTTNSKYTETIMRGPAIFGLEFNNRNDVEKAVAIENGIRNGTIFYDGESGQYYDREGKIVDAPTSDNERRGYSPQVTNTLSKLQDAAQKAGLNPSIYKSVGALYDALEDKTKNIYQVVGRAIDWDPTAAKNLGITQTSGGRGGVNQANVLYEKVGDKLVPLTAKAFEFHDPNTSKGFFGDIFQGIASIPFVAELALLNPTTAPFYPVIKGAQTVALGGDLGDAIKAGGLAYLTTNVIPKYVTPQVSLALAQNPLVSELALAGGDKFANFIIDGGTRAIVSSGLAAITGQDPDKAAVNALVSSGIGSLTKEGLQLTNIPNEYRSIVANILSSAVLGQDPTKSITGAATKILKEELKDFGKETVKSDQGSNRTKETKI
jgi:hypothetical protein